MLLGVRAKDPGRGELVIPGGGVEPFDTIDDTARREILDETGLTVELTGRVGVYEMINREKANHRVIIYSRANVTGGTLKPSSDLSDARFYSREEISGLTLDPFIRQVLKDAGWL